MEKRHLSVSFLSEAMSVFVVYNLNHHQLDDQNDVQV